MGKLEGKPQILGQNERFRDKNKNPCVYVRLDLLSKLKTEFLCCFLIRSLLLNFFIFIWVNHQAYTNLISKKYVFELPTASNASRKFPWMFLADISSKIEVHAIWPYKEVQGMR